MTEIQHVTKAPNQLYFQRFFIHKPDAQHLESLTIAYMIGHLQLMNYFLQFIVHSLQFIFYCL
ncbi:hypothetical protein CQW29_20115 [Pantoea coffeiphila]|uniref:Uncharacterized protein n=1 Tax=Pantoea coffeiphila TaxID=1465635 RepID=A0A2S9I6Y6_9GAMM|nr:hypothetical protein CQW29_20115 [Pantoea coffeiphila]